MFETFIAISVIASLIYYELTDLSPGGIITPGYLALFVDQPGRIATSFLAAFVIAGMLAGAKKILPIYGRRQYALAIVLSVVIKLLLTEHLGMWTEPFFLSNTVGMIIPGLIANDVVRQGPFRTTASVVLVGCFLFALMLVLKGVLF